MQVDAFITETHLHDACRWPFFRRGVGACEQILSYASVGVDWFHDGTSLWSSQFFPTPSAHLVKTWRGLVVGRAHAAFAPARLRAQTWKEVIYADKTFRPCKFDRWIVETSRRYYSHWFGDWEVRPPCLHSYPPDALPRRRLGAICVSDQFRELAKPGCVRGGSRLEGGELA